MFSKSSAEVGEPKAAEIAEEIRSQPEPEPAPSPMTPPREELTVPEQPVRRRVIQPTVVVEKLKDVAEDDQIRIKAEPTREGDACKFMVNRALFPGYSWSFSDFESASGSPLAERVFSIEGIESLLVHGSTATIARKDKGHGDWRPMAEEVGKVMRELLQEDAPLFSDEITGKMPSEDVIKKDIQEVIDSEVNPGVAGHGGNITLTKVEGNTVTIQMGGGCQGCSAADLTLKQGIHNAFRKAVPFVGAIYDETDHAGGVNPYYS